MDQTGSRHLLLVDDEESLRIALGEFLEYEHFRVTAVDSGEAALEAIAACRPDLVILDVSMPGMGGLGFLEAITRPDGTTDLPVLLLTAHGYTRELLAHTEVSGFLSKACSPNELKAEVERILKNRPE